MRSCLQSQNVYSATAVRIRHRGAKMLAYLYQAQRSICTFIHCDSQSANIQIHHFAVRMYLKNIAGLKLERRLVLPILVVYEDPGWMDESFLEIPRVVPSELC